MVNDDNAPYIRIKTSKDYYSHLLDKYKLKQSLNIAGHAGPNDRLHILEPQ